MNWQNSEALFDKIGPQREIAVVSAGPSLDFWWPELALLVARNVFFVLTDAVAAGFISLFPAAERLVISVENRRHDFARFLQKEDLLLYQKARWQNFSANNQFYRFSLPGENQADPNTLLLLSPGTVGGVAVAFAFACLLRPSARQFTPRLHLLGLDLAYPDLRVHSRLVPSLYNRQHGYFFNRENQEYLGVLARSSQIELVSGHIVRSSHEFARARQNLELLLDSVKFPVEILDYSPLGVRHPLVKKMVPE